jgi:hypothetical protein
MPLSLHASRSRRGDLGFGHQVKFGLTVFLQLNQRYYLPSDSYRSYRRRLLAKYFSCSFSLSSVISGSRPLSGRIRT